MKLLIVTQKMDQNDDLLGFMHAWVNEFARHCLKVTVICLEQGLLDLPSNVSVLELGKSKVRKSIKSKVLRRIYYIINFYKFIWKERANYDVVFVHMNFEYLLLGGVWWRLIGKKISLWYAHGHVPLLLYPVLWLSHIVFTSTRSGFRIASPKVHVIGQGIDTEKFKVQNPKSKDENQKLKIVTVGRISPSKDYETLVKAAEILTQNGVDFEIQSIGKPATEGDLIYEDRIKRMAVESGLNNKIKFIGTVANRDLPSYLEEADIFVNMGLTGSLDKAMVEAMSMELPVITCNEAMLEVLGLFKDKLMFEKENPESLSNYIIWFTLSPTEEKENLGKAMRKIVQEDHALPQFILKIFDNLRVL